MTDVITIDDDIVVTEEVSPTPEAPVAPEASPTPVAPLAPETTEAPPADEQQQRRVLLENRLEEVMTMKGGGVAGEWIQGMLQWCQEAMTLLFQKTVVATMSEDNNNGGDQQQPVLTTWGHRIMRTILVALSEHRQILERGRDYVTISSLPRSPARLWSTGSG